MRKIKDITEPPVLHLNLKKKWFDMIASGEKTEEYREIKPSFQRIFSVFTEVSYIKIKGTHYKADNVNIIFSNGYRKDRRQMLVECKGLCIQRGRIKWGGDGCSNYYTLKLGQILWEK